MLFQLFQKNSSLHSELYIRAEAPSVDNIETAKHIIIEEYKKYPEIIKKSKLEIVNLVSHLRVKNNKDIDKFVAVSESPDPEVHMMYVDVDYVSNEEYFRQCVNHEIWHLYDFGVSGSFTPKDELWESLNPPNFVYGPGGWVSYHTDFNNNFHPSIGFITSYSMLGIDEDKAEIFMYYFTEHLRSKLDEVIEQDLNIKGKLDLILKKCD
ncbi:MAG TPA: hypothetical protein VHA74_03340 [Candidatus Dojkabacteria bacterium]|nr:hypothetical protein [Candidatus Dojkabacteria bacterium]